MCICIYIKRHETYTPTHPSLSNSTNKHYATCIYTMQDQQWIYQERNSTAELERAAHIISRSLINLTSVCILFLFFQIQILARGATMGDSGPKANTAGSKATYDCRHIYIEFTHCSTTISRDLSIYYILRYTAARSNNNSSISFFCGLKRCNIYFCCSSCTY
jgi:hypothetical protein